MINAPPPSPAEVLRVLALTGRRSSPQDAEAVAGAIGAYGSLACAAAALAHDEACDRLTGLLAYQAAIEELADPALRIARLRLQAQDLDARAEPARAEAAEFAGKAAHRRNQGEMDLAQAFAGRARAAERQAAALEAEAYALRREASALAAAEWRRAEFAASLRGAAADRPWPLWSANEGVEPAAKAYMVVHGWAAGVRNRNCRKR
jgi:hypothetical protein